MKNNILKIFLALCPISLILMVINCSFDAQRDNPIDPLSDLYYPPATVTGRITKKNGSSIANAEIFINPGNFIGYSNGNGNYFIYNILTGIYNVSVQHPNYDSQEIQISITAGNNIDLNFTLDAKPVIDSVSVTSRRHTYNYSLLLAESSIYIYSHIYDPDGSTDMDSSLVEVVYDTIILPLIKSVGSVYQNSIEEESFPGGRIDNFLNVPFTVRVVDIDDDTTYASPMQIQMILAYDITNPEPTPNEVKPTGNFSFKWDYPDLEVNFIHSFELTITILNPPRLIFQQVLCDTSANFFEDDTFNTNAEYRHFLHDDTLDPGSYKWNISMRDAYGDYTLSDDFEFSISE